MSDNNLLNLGLNILGALSGSRNTNNYGYTGTTGINGQQTIPSILGSNSRVNPKDALVALGVLWGGQQLGFWKLNGGGNNPALNTQNTNPAPPQNPNIHETTMIRVAQDNVMPTVLNIIPNGSPAAEFITYLSTSTETAPVPMAWRVQPNGNLTNGTLNLTPANFTQLLMRGPQAAGQPSLMQGVIQARTVDANIHKAFEDLVVGGPGYEPKLSDDEAWIVQKNDFGRMENLQNTGAVRGVNNLQNQLPPLGNTAAGTTTLAGAPQTAPAAINGWVTSLIPSANMNQADMNAFLRAHVGQANNPIELATLDKNNKPVIWHVGGTKDLFANIDGKNIPLSVAEFVTMLMAGSHSHEGKNIEIQKGFALFTTSHIEDGIDKNKLELEKLVSNADKLYNIKLQVNPVTIGTTAPAANAGPANPQPTGGEPAAPAGGTNPATTSPPTDARVGGLADRIFTLAADYWENNKKALDKGVNAGWDKFKEIVGRENLPVGIANHINKYLEDCRTRGVSPSRSDANNPFQPNSPFSLKKFLTDELSKPGADLNKIELGINSADEARAAAVKTTSTYAGTPQRDTGKKVEHATGNENKPAAGTTNGKVSDQKTEAKPESKPQTKAEPKPEEKITPLSPAEAAKVYGELNAGTNNFINAVGTSQSGAGFNALERRFGIMMTEIGQLDLPSRDLARALNDFHSSAIKLHSPDLGKRSEETQKQTRLEFDRKQNLVSDCLRDLIEENPDKAKALNKILKDTISDAKQSDPSNIYLKPYKASQTLQVNMNTAEAMVTKAFADAPQLVS
ncbi:MAG TPA: hypothetical protein PKW15_03400 [Alphaproteobacteria bacterium]|nr:hypothetical protein [Rhodospirillaceae bacterium]HRJ12272.1 hypothetical protein [Alphaproteobacteria bacterium]